MGRRKNKWFKKTINFYRYVFKFESPFKVIIDGNFVAIALKKKFDLKEALSKALDENVHIVIPSCVFRELQSIEDKIPGITQIISQYKIEECKHNTMEPVNCIRSYIGKRNMDKYFVATQDKFLRSMLRKIPGVPLIFFYLNMISGHSDSHSLIITMLSLTMRIKQLDFMPERRLICMRTG